MYLMAEKISQKEAEKIAQLARLELSAEEIEKYAEELGAILTYIDKLKEVDTENVAATTQVSGLSSVTREDKVEECGEMEELVKMAPEQEDNLISVKAVF